MSSSSPDGYFYSSANPVANADQRDLEDLAMRVFERPEVREARRRALGLWLAVTDYDAPAEASDIAADAIDEYCFNYTLKAANSDANHPKVLRLLVQSGAWFDRSVRGSRLGGDNPDNCYRVIPVEHGARYEVTGNPCGSPAADVTWTLVGNNSTSKTLASLEHRDVAADAQGRFTITVDDAPAEGRRNHLQTRRGVKWLFVRDSMGDWAARDAERPAHKAADAAFRAAAIGRRDRRTRRQHHDRGRADHVLVHAPQLCNSSEHADAAAKHRQQSAV